MQSGPEALEFIAMTSIENSLHNVTWSSMARIYSNWKKDPRKNKLSWCYILDSVYFGSCLPYKSGESYGTSPKKDPNDVKF